MMVYDLRKEGMDKTKKYGANLVIIKYIVATKS